jgi:hypothetical protein
MNLEQFSFQPAASADRCASSFSEALRLLANELAGTPESGAAPAKKQAPMEMEARYFKDLPSLAAQVDFRQCPRKRISQCYLPPSAVQDLAKLLDLAKHYEGAGRMHSARLREINGETGTRHFLEFKGPKQGPRGAKIERVEISLPLDEHAYAALLPLATSGSLTKDRYSVAGHLTLKDGSRIEAVAEIDLIVAAGLPSETLQANFATIDVELAESKHLKRLRAGEHSFDFLKKGIVELSAARDGRYECLSNREIAEHGLSGKRLKLVETLIKKCASKRKH